MRVWLLAVALGCAADRAVAVHPAPPSFSRTEVAPTLRLASAKNPCAVGDTVTFSATATDAYGHTVPKPDARWTSSDATVAPVVSVAGNHRSARVLCAKGGTATVRVTWTTLTAAVAQTVVEQPPPPPPDTTPPPPPPPPPACALLTDWSAHSHAALAKPGYLQSVVDPVFGVTITRITGDPGTPVGNGIAGTWGTMSKPEYSKVQTWSADGRLLVLGNMGGAVGPGVQLFLDGTTYQPVFAKSHPGPEARWHPALADVAVYVAANGSVGHWNARTGTAVVKFATSAYTNASMGDYEGNPSYDGRYVVVQATRNADGHTVAYAVDVDAGTKFSDIDIGTNIDWSSISALGTYVVTMSKTQYVNVYTRSDSLVASWTDTPYGHADLGVNAAGQEVLFGAPSGGANAKRFVSRVLATGATTVLSPPTTWDWHSSTRNDRRRGWGYGVTNDYAGSVVDGEMYAVSLDGTRVERWGAHRSAAQGSHDPYAVPAPDGRRVVFASDWGNPTGPVQTYVASCP